MFARTERLLLRPGWSEDAPALARAIGEETIVRNLASAPWPYGVADAEAFLAKERRPDEQSYLIFRRTNRSPQLIGAVGLGRTADGTREIGYWISRPHWGLGYATEAASALLSVARHSLRIPRLVGYHFVDNPASGRVLEKLGFRPTERTLLRYSAGRRAVAPTKLFTLSLSEGRVSEGADLALEPACQMIAA
jgi:RimJ/RimL family protein N-acetyltransferase